MLYYYTTLLIVLTANYITRSGSSQVYSSRHRVMFSFNPILAQTFDRDTQLTAIALFEQTSYVLHSRVESKINIPRVWIEMYLFLLLCFSYIVN